MIPNVISGFEHDCNKLFINFEKESSVRFSTFVEIWKNLKFSLVFSGRATKEVIYFTKEALAYVKQFFMKTNSFLRKVCSIYIMYGIYYKQPIKHASQISLTFDEWLKIKEFVSVLKENTHLDTLYILLKLIFDNAFDFATHKSKRYTALPDKTVKSIDDMTDFDVDIEEPNLDELFQDLQNAEKEYSESKLQLSESLKIPYVNYSNDNITKEIKDTLKEEILKPVQSESPEMSVAEKRKSIRLKSFQKKGKPRVFRFYKSTTTNDDSFEDD